MQIPRKKADIVLLAVLLLLCALPLWRLSSEKASVRYVQITVEGEVWRKIPLEGLEPEEIVISTRYGRNVLLLDGEGVAMVSADCPDKICVAGGRIAQVGEIIACLPHRIIVEIRPAEEE
ncbi:MAG: NusG domain II-containing protein [Selenomonadaceae bacterium]|nr:NusG domain II-containing protein [Selenomonadaceae bacterium]